jgi:hypothetical protein
MSIRHQQSIFARNVARLVEWCFLNGYEVTLGESYNAAKTGHMKDSLHYERLAQDLNLFEDGKYLTDTKDYARAGNAWMQLHEDNRWGGIFKKPDGNHFSMSVGDGRA